MKSLILIRFILFCNHLQVRESFCGRRRHRCCCCCCCCSSDSCLAFALFWILTLGQIWFSTVVVLAIHDVYFLSLYIALCFQNTIGILCTCFNARFFHLFLRQYYFVVCCVLHALCTLLVARHYYMICSCV